MDIGIRILNVLIIWLQNVVIGWVAIHALTSKGNRYRTWGLFSFVTLMLSVGRELFITAWKPIAIVSLVWLVFYILYFFQNPLKKKLFAVVSIILIIYLAEGTSMLAGSSLLGEKMLSVQEYKNSMEYVWFTSLHGIVLALYLVTWMVVWKQKLLKKQPVKFISFLVFPISQFIIIVTLDIASLSYVLTTWLIVGILVGLLADILLIIVIGNQSNKEELERKLVQMNYLHKLEEQRYIEIERKREQFSKLRHDIGNQLIIMRHLIQTNEEQSAKQVLDSLQEQLQQTREGLYSQDTIINAVIEEKLEECKEHGIRLETSIEIGEVEGVQKVHLCSIVSNLLDNAIAAVCLLGEDDKRWIRISASYKCDYIVIKVVNPSLEPSKKIIPKEGHGYGKLILQDIANIYNGEYRGTYIDGLYSGSVTILGNKVEHSL